ncbi:MAG: trypsin-like peptidase domain-containing protein [Polyangiaceae bacterium]
MLRHFNFTGLILLLAGTLGILSVRCDSLKGLGSNTSQAQPSAAPSSAPSPPPTLPPPASSTVVPLTAQSMTEDERNSISVFESAAKATVFVTNKRRVVDFQNRRTVDVPAGSGSGFIWDTDGHVVTNFHVVKGAQSLSVTLYDHRTFDAEVVGVESRKDIAVLKLVSGPKDLKPIQVQRGLKLLVGQKALAIGNPFGLDQTLTTGVISALGRDLPGPDNVTIRDMVQTDCAINPGNSGGPLLDSNGRLIGMNTMIYSGSGSGVSAGIGFAVPVSAIAQVVPQIIKDGRAEQIGMGVRIDSEQFLERQFGVRGVLVIQVYPNTPAAKAGLRGTTRTPRGLSLGDIIIKIDDVVISDYDDLYTELDKRKAGDKVKLRLLRGDQQIDVDVDLIVLPDPEKAQGR